MQANSDVLLRELLLGVDHLLGLHQEQQEETEGSVLAHILTCIPKAKMDERSSFQCKYRQVTSGTKYLAHNQRSGDCLSEALQ